MYLHFLRQSVADRARGLQYASPLRQQPLDDETHLQAAVVWLNRSIDACYGTASAKAYRFARGWMPPYPETSGYIIPTLLNLEPLFPQHNYRLTAERVGLFLIAIQRADGGFIGGELGARNEPYVFDTGMILLGLTALATLVSRERFEAPARRAGDFLLGCLDDSGCFARNVGGNLVHAYNVRAAWGLMALAQLLQEQKYADGALANAAWTLRQQRDNGYFDHNAFKPGGNANLHGTSYVMRGLLEIARLAGDGTITAAVRLTADRLVALLAEHDYIAGELGPDWSYLYPYQCLTGYAQLARVLLKLHREFGERRYHETAQDLLRVVAATQNVSEPDQPHFGGIKGSHPIYGRYAPMQYPNWATKFFIDALLENRNVTAATNLS
jgi:hypothetical protein